MKIMSKKRLSLLLIFAMLFSSFSFTWIYDNPTFAYDVVQMSKVIQTQYLYDEKGAREYLQNQLDKFYETPNQRVANIGILKNFSKLVYTDSKDDYYAFTGMDDYQKGDDGQWHYKHLGYLYDGKTKVTNPAFPNLAGTTDFFTTYMYKNWIDSNGSSTWRNVSNVLANYMLTHKRIATQDNGIFNWGNISIQDVIGRSFSIDELKERVMFQTLSTLRLSGSMRMYHKILATGKTYYRTLNVEPVPFSLPQMRMIPSNDSYNYGTDELTKKMGVTAEIYFDDFEMLPDLIMADYIKEAKITVNGQEKTAYVSGDTLTAYFEFEPKRSDFKIGQEDTFTFKGSAIVFASETFKDQFRCVQSVKSKVMVDAGNVEPSFKIFNNDIEVTDGIIEYTDWEDITLTCEPDNRVYGSNSIYSVGWSLEGSPISEIKAGNKTVNYIMTQPKLSSHAVDGVSTINMTVNTTSKFDYGEQKDITRVTIPHTVEFKKVDKITPIPPSNLPPTAKLSAPRTIRMGDEFVVSGKNSYDSDGYITDYDFFMTALRTIKPLNDEASKMKVTVMSDTASKVRLVVTDNDGLTDEVIKKVNVLKAIEAKMAIEGERKVNRKVVLNGLSSIFSKYFPIDSYTWTVEPLEGQSDKSICWETNNQGGKVAVLFKEEGAYQITLNIHAQCTLPGDEENYETASVSYPIVIQPDLAPQASMSVYSIALRDIMDEGRALIEFVSQSHSLDGDDVTDVFYYRIDLENDGTHNDTWIKTDSTGLMGAVKHNKVGHLEFYNVATDVIPEDETIVRFLEPSDYLSDDSLDQPIAERLCLVDNVAPVVSSTAELKKTVDLLVITDEDGATYTSLMSEINKLKKELFQIKHLLNEKIVNLNSESVEKTTVGMKKEQTYKWHRYIRMFYEWNYYYSRYYSQSANADIFKDGRVQFNSVVDTREGTFAEMGKFPTYPQAHAKIKYSGSKQRSNYRNWGYVWEYGQYDVYNEPNDYLTTVTQPHDIRVYHNGSARDSVYTNDIRFCNRDMSYHDGNRVHEAYDNLEPPRQHQTVDATWTQGQFVSEEDVAYQIVEMEKYIEDFKDSENDKFLVFAFADGSNFFLPDNLKKKIDDYGFKVFMSMDEYWSEFSPRTPKVEDIKFEDGGLYALTKYNNQLRNKSMSSSEKLYYSYQSRDEEPIDYNDDLSSLQVVSPKTSGTVRLAQMRPINNTETDNYSEDYEDAINWRAPDRDYEEIDLIMTFRKYSSGILNVPSLTLDVGTTWELDSGKKIDVTKAYSNSALGAVVENDEGIYFVSNDVNNGNYYGHQSYTKLNLSNIDTVYSFSRKFPTVGASWYVRVNNPYYHRSTQYVNWSIGEYYNNYYIVKDDSGRFALCYMDYWSNIRSNLKVIYFSDISKFSIHSSPVQISSGDLGANRKYDYTNYKYVYEWTNEPWYLTLPNLSGITNNDLGYYIMNHSRYVLDRMGSYNNTMTQFMVVDENSNLYLNGSHIASNVNHADIQFNDNTYQYAYADNDGLVYGKGHSINGSFGHFGKNDTFEEAFNSPYHLSSKYMNESFTSPFDITSQSPEYQLVNRGLYSNITQLILDEYSDYKETEQVFIQVGDTINISAFGIDYEGDPIIDKRLDVEHDHTYFDNSNEPWIPPSDFDGEVVIDKPGRMKIQLRLQDNPVGNDENFAEFRYWNKDDTTIEAIVHRKGIAKLGYVLVPQGNGKYSVVLNSKDSYDLDHQFSRTDKGIIDAKYYVKEGLSGSFTEFSGTMDIVNGVDYVFALEVKDVELSWSDYDMISFRLDGEPFIMTSSIDPVYPSAIPAGSQISITSDIYTNKALSNVSATFDGVTIPMSRQSQSGMKQVFTGNYTIPTTKVDKNFYNVLITATAVDNTTRLNSLKANVSTPINLTGSISPYEIKKGQEGTLTATTSKYVSTVNATLFYNTPNAVTVPLVKGSTVNDVTTWTTKYRFNQNVSEGQYDVRFDASTTNGNTGTSTDRFKFIPNQPPRVVYQSQTPAFAYEGDDVTLSFLLSDPDGDPLNIQAQTAIKNDDGTYSSWKTVESKNAVLLNTSNQYAYSLNLEDIEKKDYRVRVTVIDPLGEQAQTSRDFQATALTVDGQVNHVPRWDENRTSFNRSKTQTDNAPRPINMFWPGERFILKGLSTQLSPLATTRCDQLTVSILTKNKSTNLLQSESSNWTWNGELWDESMMDWEDGIVTFRFTAHYSNGVSKTHDVDIQLDNTESYWRIHRIY